MKFADTEFPMYRVAYLLCCALEGGSGYWARIDGRQTPKVPIDLEAFEGHFDEVFYHIHYPFFEGGFITVKDVEDGSMTYILDSAKLQSGLKLMAEKQPRHFADWLGENEDAITGDCFLQFCLLGEYRYG